MSTSYNTYDVDSYDAVSDTFTSTMKAYGYKFCYKLSNMDLTGRKKLGEWIITNDKSDAIVYYDDMNTSTTIICCKYEEDLAEVILRFA